MTKFLDKVYQLRRLDNLIRLKSTGTPSNLASKFKVSERTVYNLINTLKFFGAEIKYCQMNNTYYYEGDFQFPISIEEKC